MALRAAVLGTGSWARRIHLPALAEHPGVELVGVWGRDPAAAREAAAGAGTAAFDDRAELLAAVDLVSVAVTPRAQPALAVEAARAGAHLVLEKPAAADAAGCRELAAAARAAGVDATVFLSRLWDPARWDWLDRVAGGPWRRIEYGWVSAGMRAGSPGAEGWRRAAGPLLDVGPHVLGLVEYAAGPVVAVDASAAGGHGRLDLALHHASGCVSTATIDLDAPVTSTNESILLVGDGPGARYANPEAVDFGAAYRAMLDDLLGRLADPSAVSARGLASGLDAACAMADVLDAVARRLAGAPGPVPVRAART